MNKPSVTQITGLLDKPALLSWANKIGLEGINLKDYRKKSLTAGTNYHEEINRYIKEGIEPKDRIFSNNLKEFLKDKEILGNEGRIKSNLYTGTYDIKYMNGEVKVLGDFKSSKGVYLENVLQLVAYNIYEGCEQLAVIEIPSFKVKTLQIKNTDIAEELIFNLYRIYKQLNTLDWRVESEKSL